MWSINLFSRIVDVSELDRFLEEEGARTRALGLKKSGTGNVATTNINQETILIFSFTSWRSCFFDEIINTNNLKNGTVFFIFTNPNRWFRVILETAQLKHVLFKSFYLKVKSIASVDSKIENRPWAMKCLLARFI